MDILLLFQALAGTDNTGLISFELAQKSQCNFAAPPPLPDGTLALESQPELGKAVLRYA
jgi:hypothetical protein